MLPLIGINDVQTMRPFLRKENLSRFRAFENNITVSGNRHGTTYRNFTLLF